VAKYRESQEEFKRLQGVLRNAPRYFDMRAQAGRQRLLPDCLPQPQPVLLDMRVAGAEGEEEDGGGKGSGKVRARSLGAVVCLVRYAGTDEQRRMGQHWLCSSMCQWVVSPLCLPTPSPLLTLFLLLAGHQKAHAPTKAKTVCPTL